MMSDDKSRLLIGTLAAAVIVVVGYGVFRELNPSPAPVRPLTPPATPASSPSPAPESSPSSTVASIQAEDAVAANSSGHEASVTDAPDLSYEWSIEGGTIQGVATGPSITWTAGAGTAVQLICKRTNPRGKTDTALKRITLRQPPVITRFEALPPVITEGSSAKLLWTASNSERLMLEPGSRDVTKYAGAPLEVKPAETTTYLLTATNNSGIVVTRELQIKVVPPPTITALRADPQPGSATTFTVIGEFKGGKAELKMGDQVITTSDASPLRIQVTDVKEGTSYSLKVTNEARSSVTSNLTFSTKNK